MATLPGLLKGVFQDPTPPLVDSVLSPITIPNGTTLITTKTTNETIANVDELIDYVSGDNGPNFIPQAAIDSLVSDLSLKEDSVNKGAISGYAGLDASQELLLVNFPSGTALQVLRRNAANDALEFADAAGSGITSINADTTAAQIIAAGTGLGIVDVGATHTLSIDSTVATLTGVQILTNKTLIEPTIASFINATHDHLDAIGGGTLTSVAISDFDTAVSANSDVTVNTAKVTNANHTGDVTGDAALTIADDAVTYAKMQNVVADDVLLGNVAGAGGIVTELTGAQVNLFLPVFTDVLNGLVPLSGGGTTNFLRADGTWVVPAGAGTGTLRLVKLEGATISTDREGLNFSDTATINFTVTDDAGNDEADVIAAIVNDSVVDAQIGAHTSTKITITAKGQLNSEIVYDDQANTYVAGVRQDFLGLLAGTAGLNVGGIAGNPTTQVDGDVWYNSTSNTLFGRVNGVDIDLGQSGSEVFTWTADHSMATFKLTAQGGNNVIINAPNSNGLSIEVAATEEYLFNATEADFLSNNIINLGTLNTHTVPGGTSTFALFSDNLSVFASTTSLELAGVIDDETGTGLLVFNDTPTIITPTIVSFINSVHNHEDAAGGGTLLAVAISNFDTAVSANSDVTANTAKVTNATHTGEVTGATVLTITDDAVTYAKMQNVVADDVLLGNVAGAGGIVTELTGAQVNLFLPVFTDVLNGLVPLSGGGTTNFLRADGTWAVPAGGGEFTDAWTANHNNGGSGFALEEARFADATDDTKVIAMVQSGMTTGIVLSISTSQTTAQTLTIPNITAADVIVTENFAQILINKSMDADNNTFTNFALAAEVTGAITDLSDVTAKTGTGTVAVFDDTPTLLTPTIADFTNANHDHEDVAGGGQLDSTLALSDTADIAYLNTANVWTTGLQDFTAVTMRIPTSATPTIAVDGDFALDTTVTDFSHGILKYFGTEEIGVVSMPIAQFTTPSDGFVVAYNATNDEFELVATSGGEFTGAWTANHNQGGSTFSLEDARFADPADDTKTIQMNLAGMTTTIELTISTSQTTAQTLTIPNITAADVIVTENFAQILINKSMDADNNTFTNFALAAEVTGAITDLSDVTATTGTGTIVVFDTSPVIVTPTIASFINSTHGHQAAAGGGQLDSTLALSDTDDIAYLNTANTWTTGLQDFSAVTLRIPVSATPAVTVDGDIAYDTTVTDFSTGLIRFFGTEEQAIVAMPAAQFITPSDGFVIAYNATNDEFELVAAAAGSQTPWVSNIDAADFNLNNLGNITYSITNTSDIGTAVIGTADIHVGGSIFPTNSNTIMDIGSIGNEIQDIFMTPGDQASHIYFNTDTSGGDFLGAFITGSGTANRINFYAGGTIASPTNVMSISSIGLQVFGDLTINDTFNVNDINVFNDSFILPDSAGGTLGLKCLFNANPIGTEGTLQGPFFESASFPSDTTLNTSFGTGDGCTGMWRNTTDGSFVYFAKIDGTWRDVSAGVGTEIFTINFIIDGGGSAITTGIKGQVVVDFNCEVIEWAIIGLPAGAIVVDVSKSTFAGFPTTTTLSATEKPTIVATNDTGELRTLTDWVAIVTGDILEFEVDSVATIERCTVALKCRKTG